MDSILDEFNQSDGTPHMREALSHQTTKRAKADAKYIKLRRRQQLDASKKNTGWRLAAKISATRRRMYGITRSPGGLDHKEPERD